MPVLSEAEGTAAPRRPLLYCLIALALLLGAIYWVVAAPALAPPREEMTLRGVPVLVDYTTSVSSDDLLLPFYPGAKPESAFAYTVKTEEGKQVAYYASALFTSSDPPDKIAASYQAQLPGHPNPELVEDNSGERYVVAVADEGEVREVTITANKKGSRLHLLRATRPTLPPKTPRPGPRERTV